MSEPFLDGLRVSAACDRQRRGRVSKVVPPERRKASPGDGWRERSTGEVVSAKWRTRNGREDVVLARVCGHVRALAGRDDRAALVGCTISDPPHIFVERQWIGAVPILDVEDAIRDVSRRRDTLRIAMDPARWSRTPQVLEGLPVIEYPLSASRMIPASARFKEAVENGQLTHSGDEELSNAVGNTR